MLSESAVNQRLQVLVSSFASLADPTGIAPVAPAAGASLATDERFTGLSIRQILVPLDGSSLAEGALPQAVSMARVFQARVRLLRVLELPGAQHATGTVDALEWEIRRAESQIYLTKLQEQLAGQGVLADMEIVQGRAAEQILARAAACRADLIAVSSHGESGATPWRVSSTTEKVIAGAATSVLLVPASASIETDVRVRRILLPLDCSQRAECILPAAIALASHHGADLILAHVVLEPDLPRRIAPSSADLRLAEELTERNRVEANRYLRDLGQRLTPHWSNLHVRLRVAAERSRALQDLADEEAVDLIVLSAHGSSGDPTKPCGSLSERLLREMRRPVLVLQDLAQVLREHTAADH